ncbi:MAG TPA: hypothetical protein VNI20_10040 [Fimbriimonadaceae bacterium]|nr:hypothetical protein [Fimbriimonadaceae bacterium]
MFKRSWFLAVFLVAGCGPKGPISSSAGWILDQGEFDAYYLDTFSNYPTKELSTEKIGFHYAGTNLLLHRHYQGKEAKEILGLLRASEQRDYFTKPVDLAPTESCVLRFKNSQHTVDVGIDPRADGYIEVFTDGNYMSGRIYKSKDKRLTAALSPFLNLFYQSGRVETELFADRESNGVKIDIVLTNATTDDVTLPPLDKSDLTVLFRNAKGKEIARVIEAKAHSNRTAEPFLIRSDEDRSVTLKVPNLDIEGVPTQVMIEFTAHTKAGAEVKASSGWVDIMGQ